MYQSYPAWLPVELCECYKRSGTEQLFVWQAELLENERLRAPDYENLIFSAPTSSGKTLVAELLAANHLLDSHQKALFVYPYVSVGREKFVALQKFWRKLNLRVTAFMGTSSSSAQSWDAAVCTIEKANSLLNRTIDDDQYRDIGVLVMDEFHMLFDHNRGLLVEQIICKILYIKKFLRHKIQLICMSATLPSVRELSKWLEAEVYETQFRPVKLTEYLLCGTQLFDAQTTKLLGSFSPKIANDCDHIVQLCVEAMRKEQLVLIFCSSKAETERIALLISQYLSESFKNGSETEICKLLNGLELEVLSESNSEILDIILRKTIPYGVAFHHAGLTVEERAVVEGAYRTANLRVLCATSTLSSGVNLPSNRVIIRAQTSGPVALTSLSYAQMIGRAGRFGHTTEGSTFSNH